MATSPPVSPPSLERRIRSRWSQPLFPCVGTSGDHHPHAPSWSRAAGMASPSAAPSSCHSHGGGCHQPRPTVHSNWLWGVTNSIVRSPVPSCPSGSPFGALRLSKALELIPDKGNITEKKKIKKGTRRSFECDVFRLGLLAFLAERLNVYSVIISLQPAPKLSSEQACEHPR